jgi:lactoylglutathione lyase
MNVEQRKSSLGAADMERPVGFYAKVFGGSGLKRNDIVSETSICGGEIGIQGDGEGVRAWTGLGFQVPDFIADAAEIVAVGGKTVREPRPDGEEPTHLAMCGGSEGNEVVLTHKRS